MLRDPDGDKPWDVIEASGRGADQFAEAIRYYDWEQTTSVLAGFTELANAAASGTGSYALSADQSEFFLASEQAVADEIADQIVEGLFRPLTVVNFGVDAEVPGLRIGPVGNRQTDRALALVEQIIGSASPNVPAEFTGALLAAVAESLGLDTEQLTAALNRPAPAPKPPKVEPDGPVPAEPGPVPVAASHHSADECLNLAVSPDPVVERAPVRHPSRRDRRRTRR